MELIDFANNTDKKSVFDLEKKLIEIVKYINFLTQYCLMKEENINSNNKLFYWYHHIPEDIEKSKNIIENKTVEFQNILKGKMEVT